MTRRRDSSSIRVQSFSTAVDEGIEVDAGDDIAEDPIGENGALLRNYPDSGRDYDEDDEEDEDNDDPIPSSSATFSVSVSVSGRMI
jgi:hypothetical protein